MNKILAMLLALLIVLPMSACGSAEPEVQDDGIIRIAIVQQLTHASLNEIRQAVITTLKAHAAQNNEEFVIDTFNGQDDTEALNQISAEIMAADYDLVIPIATRAATIMATAAHGEIPVVYAAVSDPAHEGLTDMENVTGTRDALDTNFIMDMLFVAKPKAKTIGLLYSSIEHNSEKAIQEAKAYLDAKGVAYLDMPCASQEEIVAAAQSMVGKVQAVFTPTDNEVMAVEEEVAKILNGAGIPQFAGADAFVRAGAFATFSVDYTELGEHTAQLALSYLHDGVLLEDEVMEGKVITVNTNTAHEDHLDPGVFIGMADLIKMVGSGIISY